MAWLSGLALLKIASLYQALLASQTLCCCCSGWCTHAVLTAGACSMRIVTPILQMGHPQSGQVTVSRVTEPAVEPHFELRSARLPDLGCSPLSRVPCPQGLRTTSATTLAMACKGAADVRASASGPSRLLCHDRLHNSQGKRTVADSFKVDMGSVSC